MRAEPRGALCARAAGVNCSPFYDQGLVLKNASEHGEMTSSSMMGWSASSAPSRRAPRRPGACMRTRSPWPFSTSVRRRLDTHWSAQLREIPQPLALNVIQSNGSAAWQEVFHYHVHLVPRFSLSPRGQGEFSLCENRNSYMLFRPSSAFCFPHAKVPILLGFEVSPVLSSSSCRSVLRSPRYGVHLLCGCLL